VAILLMTSPHARRRMHTVDPKRGVWVNGIWYQHDELRRLKKGIQCEIRIEPWNARVVYVNTQKQWVAAVGTHLVTAEQRLWRLADVSCCPTHRVRLFTPLCGKERAQQCDPYARVMHPGVCSGCGSVGYRCATVTPEAADEGEVWRAAQCAGLLRAMQQTHWTRNPTAMRALVEDRATKLRLDYHGMAQRMGGSESIFCQWLHERNTFGRIAFAQLIDIAGVEGISLASLLSGKFHPVDTPACCRTPHRMKRVIRRVDHAALKVAMRQALVYGRGARDVAAAMKVDLNTLRQHQFLYGKLRENTQRRQEEDTKARHNAALEEAVATATAMIERGLPVTLRNACVVSNERWYPSQLRAKCLQVLVSVLRHGGASALVQMGGELLEAAVEAGRKLSEGFPMAILREAA
jgi:hypothetical protein